MATKKTDTTDTDSKVTSITEAKSVVEKAKRDRLEKMLDCFEIQCLRENELGDSRLFVRENKNDLVCDMVNERWGWYVWEGHYWKPDYNKTALIRVDRVTEVYKAKMEEIDEILDDYADDTRDPVALEYAALYVELKRKVHSLNALAKRKSVLQLAVALGIGVEPEVWDSKSELLGLLNGTYELMTGIFRDGRPEDYIRTVAPIEYNPKAKCPRFLKALGGIFNNDIDMVNYFLRTLGCALVGSVKEHVLFICYGALGNNGKTMLFELIRSILGSKIATGIDSSLLLRHKFDKQSGAPNASLMDLRGLRFAWCAEINEGVKLDGGIAKKLTGGDTLSGRYPYESKNTSFKPSHTLFMLINDLPHVPNDKATWNRIWPIPFKITFVENEPKGKYERKIDYSLPDKLREESQGILNLLIESSKEYLNEGLKPPRKVIMSKMEYQEREDTIGRFISTAFTRFPDNNRRERMGKIYEAYKEWCEEEQTPPVSLQRLSEDLSKRGFKRMKTGHLTWVYGLQFIPERWDGYEWTRETVGKDDKFEPLPEDDDD